MTSYGPHVLVEIQSNNNKMRVEKSIIQLEMKFGNSNCELRELNEESDKGNGRDSGKGTVWKGRGL